MAALARRRREIERAWQTFVADGRSSRVVRPEIRRSWERVRGTWQVDPQLQSCPRHARGPDALDRAEADGTLRIASPLVAEFAERLRPGGHVVALFDADGVMLGLRGDARTRSRLADVNFAPGACWSERAAGTNGPGTSLTEARPVEVFASEHFVEAWQPWTCASAPVRFAGRLVGAVDITSPWRARVPSLLPTAEALARAIEAQLELEAEQTRSALLLQVARDALRARDDFLAVASHELKTPLTPLRVKVQQVQRILERTEGDAGGDALVKALRGIDGHVDRLVGAMNGLLDAARAVRDPIRLLRDVVELGSLVRAVVERRLAELDRHGCAVTVATPAEVSGRWDPVLVARAIDHLLVNAIRHAPGPIGVEVGTDGACARVRVRDRGPGIARRDQERIFEPYERAVSSRESSGFGLGLYVARQIAEAHGGSVAVESAPGRGSAFELTLPLEGASAAPG